MDPWLSNARDAIAAASDVDPSELDLSDADTRALLDLARIAAHDSGARTNAPLLCYLVGRVQGERSLDELAEAIRRSSA